MLRRMLVVLLLLGLPGLCLGQSSERFLSPGSHFYLRWDGFDANRADFDKTATGQMLKGEMGQFLSALWTYLNDQMEPLLKQADPEVAAVAKDIPGALEAVFKNGFSMAVEVRQINPPQIEAAFVFPRNGGPKGALANMVKKALEITHTQTKELKVDEATLQHFAMEPLHWAFGSDGDTALMVVGTVDPAGVIRRGSDKGNNVTKHPLYKQLQSFREFPVWSQGFVDFAGLMKQVGGFSPQVAQLIEDLGLNNLKSITFHSGFDGPAERTVTEIHIPGPRKGLLLLTKGRKISLDVLPALPEDLTGFSVGSMEPPVLYDVFSQVVEAGVRIFSPDAAAAVKEGIKQLESLVGVKLRDDLLGSLGEVYVTYNSPADGPLGLGRVNLIQVKDAKKLVASLEAITRTFPQIPGLEYDLKKRTYRGVDLVELHMGTSFTTPTFTIHKGWLAIANYPQPIHAFIMRSKGDLPTWKADAKVLKALAPFPKEFTSVSYSDPRPSFQFLLSLVPPVMSAINGATRQFLPGSKVFDVSTIPHPHEASRYLFPNITVSTDDGQKIRIETRASLALPF